MEKIREVQDTLEKFDTNFHLNFFYLEIVIRLVIDSFIMSKKKFIS